MHSPKASYMEAAMEVVRYVKQAPGLGILMAANTTDQLIAYCDRLHGYIWRFFNLMEVKKTGYDFKKFS